MALFGIVFVGGGFGATLRYFLSFFLNNHFKKLWLGTFVVNILGCLIYYFSFKYFSNSDLNKQLIRVGFCGSLTTFSTFSFEIFSLIQTGQHLQAVIILLLNVVLGVAMGYLIL